MKFSKSNFERRMLQLAKDGNVIEFAVCHKKGGNINGGYRTNTTLIIALKNDNIKIASYIITNNGNFNARESVSFKYDIAKTALMICLEKAQRNADYVPLAIRMIEQGANVNLVDYRGFSAIGYACHSSTEKAFELIIQKIEISRNKQVNIGRKILVTCNPLYQIYENQSHYFYFWEKLYHAQPNADYDGLVDRQIIGESTLLNMFQTVLLYGFKNSKSNYKKILLFLKICGIDIHNESYTGNAAHIIVRSAHGTPEIFDFIIRMGISPDIKHKEKTARELARYRPEFDIILRRHEAEQKGLNLPEIKITEKEIDNIIIQAVTQSLKDGLNYFIVKDKTGYVSIVSSVLNHEILYEINADDLKAAVFKKIKT